MINNPLAQLTIVRMKEFFREPEAIFWTYGFPLIMVIVLGLAFRDKPADPVAFDVMAGPGAERIKQAVADDARFDLEVHAEAAALARLRDNKTLVVVGPGEEGGYAYRFDPTNPEARAARDAVDDALQRAAGRVDAVATEDVEVTTPGSRYVDFLVPGLIGMNLMGGGMWGIGFILVNMRVRKLLKRMLATPMRRRDFLLSMVGMRSLFFLPEVAFLLAAAYLIFQVPVRGSFVGVVAIAFIGSFAFAGLGLLVACRARRIETVSGLMNLVMMPMWLASGIFFSYERFPEYLHPFIKALPLTQLIDALRAVMLEGASVPSQALPMLIVIAWGVVSFALALRWFRWVD